MDEMRTRHERAAQVLQNRMVKALADGAPVTPELLRMWVEAIRIERTSVEDDLGFEPPDLASLLTTLDEAALRQHAAAVRREQRRRKAAAR